MRLSKRGRDVRAGEFISYWQVPLVGFRPDRPMPLNLDGEPRFARVRALTGQRFHPLTKAVGRRQIDWILFGGYNLPR
jgi:hypothetical protein